MIKPSMENYCHWSWFFDERKIVNKFNAFFRNLRSELASKIPNALTTFESYINRLDSIMEIKQFSMNQLKNAFFSLKINKSHGYDDISFNVLKKCFSSLIRTQDSGLRIQDPGPKTLDSRPKTQDPGLQNLGLRDFELLYWTSK